MENKNFREQLADTDVIMANKEDRWDENTRQALRSWQDSDRFQRPVITTRFGKPDTTLPDRPGENLRPLEDGHNHPARPPLRLAALPLRHHCRRHRSLNEEQGYYSCGWVFDEETISTMAAC